MPLRLLTARAKFLMPEFCDVALAVPLDTVFTYRIPDGMQPVVGGRVLVPFRQQRHVGYRHELHDREPLSHDQRISSACSIRPGARRLNYSTWEWIADYYLAPVGEVFRTMLPLSAEFKTCHRLSHHR